MREITDSNFLILLIIDRFFTIEITYRITCYIYIIISKYFWVQLKVLWSLFSWQDVATDFVKPKTNTIPFEVTRQDNLVQISWATPLQSLINLCSSCTEFPTYLVSDWSRCFCPFTATQLVGLSLKLVGQLVMDFFKSNLWSCSMEFRCFLASDWLISFCVFVDKPLIGFSSSLVSKLILDLPWPG